MKKASEIQAIERSILALKQEVYQLSEEATRLWREAGGYSEEFERASKKENEARLALLEAQGHHYEAITA